MATTEAQAEYSAEQMTAYEAYLAAMAEHNIVCARPAATTRDKMDAAFAVDRAFCRFADLSGFRWGRHLPGAAQPVEDVQLLNAYGRLTESVRSAWSMMHAVISMGVFSHCPDGVTDTDHDAAYNLFTDAEVIVRKALDEADGK